VIHDILCKKLALPEGPPPAKALAAQ